MNIKGILSLLYCILFNDLKKKMAFLIGAICALHLLTYNLEGERGNPFVAIKRVMEKYLENHNVGKKFGVLIVCMIVCRIFICYLGETLIEYPLS